MKDIVKRINEEKAIATLVQYEVDKDASYHTINVGKVMEKYKYGFVSFNSDEEFVAINGFNSVEDFSGLLGGDGNSYDKIDGMEVGQSVDTGDEIWTRIW